MNVLPTPWSDRALVITGAVDDAVFSETELATANAFKLAKRREEWLLSRAAAKQLALQLGIAGNPRSVSVDRPHLIIDGQRTEWYVSISHTAHHAGAAIARDPVGIDVQFVRTIAEWSSHLFLSDGETAEMHRCGVSDRVLHFWCAKEAAFKKSGTHATMKQLPLRLLEERELGLVFDLVETVRIGDVIVALTR